MRAEHQLLLGRGDGSFAPKRHIPVGANPRGITLADVDRDGKLDVLVTQYGAAAWRALYGDGAGRIARSTGRRLIPCVIIVKDLKPRGCLLPAQRRVDIQRSFPPAPPGRFVAKISV